MAIKGARPPEPRVIAHLMVSDGKAAMDFYKRAFGAKVLYESPMPGGNGIHAQLQIADSVVMISDWRVQHPEANLGSPQVLGGTTVILERYVEDVDAAVHRAVDAGATIKLPVNDTFFGDRYGWVLDPFGHIWALATAKQVLTPEELHKRMEEYMQKHG